MKKIFIISFLAYSYIYGYSQVTLLENYYDRQGGIEGLYFPNMVLIDSNEQNFYLTAFNCITHLSADLNSNLFSFIESLKSDSISGLHNATEVIMHENELFFYVIGDHNLMFFQRDTIENRLTLKQNISNQEDILIGYGVTSDLDFSSDFQYLFLATSQVFSGAFHVFKIDSISGKLSLTHSQNDFGSVESTHVSEDGKHIYCTFSYYSNNCLNVYELSESNDSLILLQEIPADDNLSFPLRVTESNDKRNIYVSTYENILVYSKNKIDGSLSFIQKIEHGNSFLTISGDDLYIYSTSQNTNGVATYARDLQTGQLSLIRDVEIEFFDDNVNVEFIALSKSDTILIALNGIGSSLIIFDRDLETGVLSLRKKITDKDGKIFGLSRARDIITTYDGKQLYTMSEGNINIIGIYERDNKGKLEFIRSMKFEELGPEMYQPYFFEILKNDKYIYCGSRGVYVLRVFIRNANNGELEFHQALTLPDYNINSSLREICIASDQQNLYAATYSNIVNYDIDTENGDLTYISNIDVSNKNPGLEGINFILNSNDGKNIYTTSSSSFGHTGISVYSRDLSNGNLIFIDSIQYIQDSIENLNPMNIIISPDDKYLYSIGSSIHCFSRNNVDGKLTFLEEYKIEDLNLSHLNFDIYKLDYGVISPDGKSLIGVAKHGKSLVSFYRDQNTGLLTFEQHKTFSNESNYSTSSDPKIHISSDLMNLYLISDTDEQISSYELNIPLGIKDITIGCHDSCEISIDTSYNCLWSDGETSNNRVFFENGNYHIFVTDTLGREGWDSTQIELKHLFLNLGFDTTILVSDMIKLSPEFDDPGPFYFLWNDNSTSPYLYVIGSNYGLGEHTISTTVSTDYGCVMNDTIVISFVEQLSKSDNKIDLSVYPNPIHNSLKVTCNENFTYTLYNQNGNIVLQGNSIGKSIFEFNSFSNGIYVLEIISFDKKYLYKILKL